MSEEKEAEIIRIIFSPGYSHAERILHRLNRLQVSMPHHEAIEQIHREVTADPLSGGSLQEEHRIG